MTLLEECKHDCEKIDKKVNDHFSSKKSSWIPFKWCLWCILINNIKINVNNHQIWQQGSSFFFS